MIIKHSSQKLQSIWQNTLVQNKVLQHHSNRLIRFCSLGIKKKKAFKCSWSFLQIWEENEANLYVKGVKKSSMCSRNGHYALIAQQGKSAVQEYPSPGAWCRGSGWVAVKSLLPLASLTEGRSTRLITCDSHLLPTHGGATDLNDMCDICWLSIQILDSSVLAHRALGHDSSSVCFLKQALRKKEMELLLQRF